MFALALLSFVVPALANLAKPTLFKDGLSPHVDSSFWSSLHAPPSTTRPLAAGTLPQACLDNANRLHFNPVDLSAFTVTYNDCNHPWTFCRHRSAEMRQDQMIDLFGRLPVRERQWVRHVIAVPGGGSAYMLSADIVLQGDVATPSVFQHETGHAVDFYKNNQRSSGTSTWKDAIAADGCVPDNYANSNEIEDYAQVGVLALYDIVKGLDSIGADWRCLSRQKNALDGFQKSDMLPGGTCARWWADDKIVNAQTGLPIAGFVASSGPVPDDSTAGPTKFSDLVFNETASEEARKNQEQWQAEAAPNRDSSEL